MKKFLVGIGSIILIFSCIFALKYAGVLSYSFFAPKYEDARRTVFENTQSFIEGKKQELIKYRLEYMRSEDAAEKEALRITIISSMANVDRSKLPMDLQQFLISLR